MKSLPHRILVILALASSAVFLCAIPVTAQTAYQGSFTLPHEVRWQNIILPAGAYTFKMKSVAAPSLLIIKGKTGSYFITAVVADDQVSQDSALILESRGGRSAVRAFRMAGLNRTLRYRVPKAPEDAEVAQLPATRESILVAVNTK